MKNEFDLTVVIPAYNEEDRIIKTLPIIYGFLKQSSLNFELLVVDDGSKDKTIEVVKKLNLSGVKVIGYGKNRGKGYAVNFGVKSAQGDWILVADADNSTPIDQFNHLWFLREKFPVIIGSRYLKDSFIALRQGVPRIIMSRLGNLLVQGLLLPGIKDSQCGFKLFEAAAAKKIFPKQTVWRWGFDMEILRIAKENCYAIKEVPVRWLNDDQSKIQSSNVFIKTLGELLTIKRRSVRGEYNSDRSEATIFSRWLLVSVIGTVLDILVLNISHLYLGLNLYVAVGIGFSFGAVNNYLLSAYWAYSQKIIWKKFVQFLFVALGGLILSDLIVFIFTGQFEWPYNLSKILAIGVVFFWNYFVNRAWTFRIEAK